jgi:hypothetical protein
MSDDSDLESRGAYMPLAINSEDETESIPEPAPAAYVQLYSMSFHDNSLKYTVYDRI